MLRQPSAAFLLNGAITRPATGSITFRQPYRSYMQSFVKIGVLVLEKNADEIMTLCNFNKDNVCTVLPTPQIFLKMVDFQL